MNWKSGVEIVRRYMRSGRILAAQAVRVIGDDEEGLVFCILPGAEREYPHALAGTNLADLPASERFASPWKLVRGVHDVPAVVGFMPRGSQHTVLGFYEETGDFRGWYVNLESGRRRWARGIDMTDVILDVWLPVGGGVEWLDEDEVEPALAAGVVTTPEIEAARAEAERALERFERRTRPFCDGWETWRPDPSWPAARLPIGWDG
jgi:uncharacterized protein